jgi:hypothetical protein
MTKKDVNEYLYYEFGIDGDESSISENWPFHLHSVGSLQLRGERTEFYEFTDDETDYYAQEGFFFPKAGMALDDLYLQDLGQQWLGEQRPVDLNTSIIGDDQVPTVIERRRNIEALATKALGDGTVFNVVEGLFLRKTGSYLALLEIHALDNAVVIGTDLNPISVGFPDASSYRRLSYALGKFLQDEKKL